jgi:hypothetical protein
MQAEKVDFEQVIAGLKTKSDKIRALSRHGVPTAEIARYLDIRYQHARNVLKEAGLHRVAGAEPQPAHQKQYDWVELRGDGGLVLPAALLAAAGLEPGQVHVRQTEDGLEILSRRAALARAQAIARRYMPAGSPSMVDELIAERRREAARENE